jgi:predicted phosphohydrolase
MIYWGTDLHLEWIGKDNFRKLCKQWPINKKDILFITGDISNYSVDNNFIDYLKIMINILNIPIYFVLGNHDFWGGRIGSIIANTIENISNKNNDSKISKEMGFNKDEHLDIGSSLLHYLDNEEYINISKYNRDTYIIGTSGWYDISAGAKENTTVWLNDFDLITDFALAYYKPRLFESVKKIAARFNNEFDNKLNTFLNKHGDEHCKLFILTHVPPYEDSAKYNMKPTDSNFLPLFTNIQLGKIIDKLKDYPNIEVTVLCGHTHCYAHYQPAKNIVVIAQGAEYKYPKIEELNIYPIRAK